MNRKTRKVLTMNKMHQPKADIHKLYVIRKGGRGLLQIEATNKAQIISTAEY